MVKVKKTIVSILLVLVLFATACSNQKTADVEFTPGTYTGEAKGMGGNLTVEVVLEKNSIAEVNVTEHNETPGISDPALENVPKNIVAYQSLDVDTVAGATVTSGAILAAVEMALKESGADVQALKKSVKKNEGSDELIQKTADVVIIGGGGSGLSAAVSALRNDASVIILEKMPTLGGSTIMAGGQYNAVDKARQEKNTMRPELVKVIESYTTQKAVNKTHQRLMDELAAQIKEYKETGSTYVFDSPQLHALQSFKGGDQKGNLELIETLTLGAEESIGWLEELGVEFQDHVGTVTGALWQRTHQFVKPLVTGPIDAYVEFIEKSGDQAEIMLETRAYEIIMKDGRAVGVKARQNNHEVAVTANKGVIIATGGFARNQELISKYNVHWDNLSNLNSTNSVSATGDGILMAEAVNANLVGMEYIQLLPVGNPTTGGMSGNISINAANQLFVNNKGERFVAEDARRDTLTKGLLAQPDQAMWILHDAHEYTSEDVKNDFNEPIGQLVENGLAVKGETIEELAKNMGVDPAALVKTVDTYNMAVQGKIADPVGKKLMQDTFDKPPFYAAIRVPTIHHTMGGIEINKNAQVIDKNGKVIKGLYAAGEVTGGTHGANRLGGNAIPDTVVFGRIAGKSAALEM